MSACGRGCKTRGEHVTDCDDDACAGCRPRRADYGTLCARCHADLRRDLSTAPSLIDWLREHVEPGAPGQDGKTTGSRVPPAPLSTNAVAAADDLHAQIVSWALLVIEEHPSQLRGPSWVGSVVRPASKRVITPSHDALGYPVHLGYHEPTWTSAVVYEPARVLGVHSDRPPVGRHATRAVVRWLLAHIEWLEAQEWAAEMVRELTSTTATLLSRWPMEARTRPITDMPCPACDRLSLVYYPVTVKHAQTLVQCEHHDCGKQVDEDMWDWYARVYADTTPAPERTRTTLTPGHEGYGGAA